MKKKQTSLATITFVIWIISLIVFALLILIAKKRDLSDSQQLLLWGDIGVGVISFIATLLYVFLDNTKKFRKKLGNKINKYKNIRQLKIILLLLILLLTAAFAGSIVQKGINWPNSGKELPKEKFPVEKLKLTNVIWKNGVLSGDVQNNSDSKVFNIKVNLYVSKDRSKWEVNTTESVDIPWVIFSNDSYHFEKNIQNKQKDPWWTTEIISAEYYEGQKIAYPSPSQKPTTVARKPTQPNQPANSANNSNNNDPWGVAKQIDDVTWTMKIGFDDRMATPKELFEALNIYRNRYGSHSLQWDDKLAAYAQSRADYFASIKNTDKHKGFKDFLSNPDNYGVLGATNVSENSSYGYRLTGVHIIEWMYAGDEPHNKNQLDTRWNRVGIGVNGTATDFIFGS